MRVDEHEACSAFEAAAGPFLERDEAASNPVLGRLERFGASGGSGVARGFAVLDQGEVLAAALETGAHGLILSAGPGAAFEALAERAHERGARVSFAEGPVEAVAAFAGRLGALSGARAEVRMELRLHRLDEVREVRAASGALRAAGEGDAELAADWMGAFCRETGVPMSAGRAPALALGRLFLWQPAPGRAPSAMATWSRPTRRGCSIGAVYTPPEERGRGYASALVAALSRQLLAQGRAFCTLFTDRANPVSNRIYARIGYRPLADHVHACMTGPGGEEAGRSFRTLGEGDPARAAIPPGTS